MVFRIFFHIIVVFVLENNGYRLSSNTSTELIPICVPFLSDYDNCTIVGECEDCIRCLCNSSNSWECTRLQKCQDNLQLMDTADSYVLGNLIDDDQGLENGDMEVSRRKKRDTLANTIARELNDTSDEDLDELFNKTKSEGDQNHGPKQKGKISSTEKPASESGDLPKKQNEPLPENSNQGVSAKDHVGRRKEEKNPQTLPQPKLNQVNNELSNKVSKTEVPDQNLNADSTRRELNEIDKKTIENDMEQNEIKVKTNIDDSGKMNRPFEISAHEKMKGLSKNKSLKDEYKKLAHTIAYEIKPGVEYIGDKSVKPSVNINFKLVSGQTSSAHFAGELINRIWDLLQNGLPEDSLKQAVVQNMGTLMNYNNDENSEKQIIRTYPELYSEVGKAKPDEIAIKYITGVTNSLINRVGMMENKLDNHININNENPNKYITSEIPIPEILKSENNLKNPCKLCKENFVPNVQGENINIYFKDDPKSFFSEIPFSIGNNSKKYNATEAQKVLNSLLHDKSWLSFVKVISPLIPGDKQIIDLNKVAIWNETSALLEKINHLTEIFEKNLSPPKIDISKLAVVLDTEQKIRTLMRRDNSENTNQKFRTEIETLLSTLDSNLKNFVAGTLEIIKQPNTNNYLRTSKFISDSYASNLKTPKDVEMYVEAIKCIGNVLDLMNTPNSGVIFKVNEILTKLNNRTHQENKSSEPSDLTKRSIYKSKKSPITRRNDMVENLTENMDRTMGKISDHLIENDSSFPKKRMLKKEDILRHLLINKIRRKSRIPI